MDSTKKKKFYKKPAQKEIRRKKSDIKRAEETLTEHHRRPRSLGGTGYPENISYISEEIHKAWTIVSGNMNAEQICNHINTHFKPKGVTLICEFINGSRCIKMGAPGSTNANAMSFAWRTLFRKHSRFRDKIEFINNQLLDPSYHFYVRE